MRKIPWTTPLSPPLFLLVVLLALLFNFAENVDRSKFKSCEQSGFCKRQRNLADGAGGNFEVDLDSGKVQGDFVSFPVRNKDNGHPFLLEVHALRDGTFRVVMNEANPLHPRYRVEYALLPELDSVGVVVEKGSGLWKIGLEGMGDKYFVEVHGSPFKLDFFSEGKKVAVFNGRNTLKFEHLRNKPDVNNNNNEEGEEGKEGGGEEVPQEPAMWEESFSSHTDSKPRGPESIGVDIDFPQSQNLYGIPEHADDFRLKDTGDRDPFRLYNLDVFEYELNSPMTLYGSIPYMMAHSPDRTVGVLWVNAAETWIDVKTGGGGIVDSIVNLVGGSDDSKEGRTRWMSESGIIEVFFFLGPSPLDVFKQYGKVTGVTPLPQMWAIGSHQCRWNYNDEEDVRQVDENFDLHDIPYDSIWLDIEHTDGKKYFTWDSHKFPRPVEMIQNISSKGRKMITIIDPHIKREGGYFLHEDALANDLYVKDQHGKVYEGWCWPGSSSYLDFFDPKVRDYWASRFALDKYPSTLDLYTWNDMNEPSVFNGPEVTMPKDMKHYGGWEHRHVHNMYGLLQTMATFEGQLKRSEGQLRPFILTRAHFIGSQRYAAVWTGDNMADWGHLKASIPMCLSLSISGISHCGADIGGFFHNPDGELMLRWYQAAAFQPFMRNHAHIETKRREPWLFGDRITALIRSAVRRRYALLPYWYTLFYENEVTGYPPMRPLWAHYPQDQKTFGIQDAHLVGEALLVHPVTDKGATSINVYLPQGVWYDFYSYVKYEGGSHALSVTDDTIPVFQKAGTIIPTKQRIRRASSLMKDDPYTLFIALDGKGEAEGSLYIDDQQSYDYRKGNYIKIQFTYKNNKLSSKVLHAGPTFKTGEWIERLVILGANKKAKDVQASSKSVGTIKLEAEGDHPLVVRKPGVLVSEDWEIQLHF